MRVTVSIPDAAGMEAERLAREVGTSISALYAEAVEHYIQELRRQRAIERIDRLIGAAAVASDALDGLEEIRRKSDRSIE